LPAARHSHSSSPLFLASTNPGKLREFQAAALDFQLAIEPVPNLGALPPCIEDGKTFEANARKKALHYAASAPGPVFADDSGICVDELGGAPGVFSARFAGPNASDEENNQKLAEALRNHDGTWRGSAAHYICVIALAEGSEVLRVFEGRADGRIIFPPRGNGGFGYDPYFFFSPLGKTFAELAPAEKFAVSHRGIAFRKLLESLS
jgi:XTP/dITP diphosphohydrolase